MTRNITIDLTLATATVIIVLTVPHVRAQPNQWGTVKGRITWGGKQIPKQEPIAGIETHADRAACTKDGNVVLGDKYVVNQKNKGLRWTFVWLANENVNNGQEDGTPARLV